MPAPDSVFPARHLKDGIAEEEQAAGKAAFCRADAEIPVHAADDGKAEVVTVDKVDDVQAQQT
jgi:hypothetical protein